MQRMWPLLEYLKKKAKSRSDSIVGFWVSHEPDKEIDPAEPYEMTVYVVYTVDEAAAIDNADAYITFLLTNWSHRATRIVIGIWMFPVFSVE